MPTKPNDKKTAPGATSASSAIDAILADLEKSRIGHMRGVAIPLTAPTVADCKRVTNLALQIESSPDSKKRHSLTQQLLIAAVTACLPDVPDSKIDNMMSRTTMTTVDDDNDLVVIACEMCGFDLMGAVGKQNPADASVGAGDETAFI